MGNVERQPLNPSRFAPTSRPAPASAQVPPPPPTTPAARRPGTPRKAAAQGTFCAACVLGSGNNASCKCKQDSRSRHNQMHHDNEATSTTKGIVEPHSQDKLKMARFSGGTYSKPEPRLKLIPAAYGSQKRHCRRSVTPPPSSRRVSLLGSRSLAQNPMPPESSYNSCLPRERLETAENRDPCAGGHISSSVTPCNSPLKSLASPSYKSSQPLSTNLNTDATPRNLDKMVGTQAFASSSSILRSQGQNSEKMSGSLPKEAVTNPMAPSSKQIPHPSDNPLVTKAGPSKSVCTSESGKLCSRDINLTTSTTVPVLQAPIVEPALLSPTSVLSERSVEVCPDTRTTAPITQEPSVKSVLLTPIPAHRESSTEVPPKYSAQSIASAQHGASSQERNSGASISHSRSSESRHNMDILETGAPLMFHTKLHMKHYQSEACWKGNFHVTGGLIHTCDGIEAHFPLHVSVRVYEASKQMPEILNLEAVPLSQLWPKKFKMVPPNSEDIGLWFVSSHQRSHQSFDQLLGKVCSHTDLGLFTKIGDTELAVFSSKLLTPQEQKTDGKLYFWGVFGKSIRKKTCQPKSHIKNLEISNPSQPNDLCNKYEKVGMKLDVTKVKQKESAGFDIGMTLGANGGNTTDVTGNRETARDNYEGVAKVLDLTGGEDSDRANDCRAVLGTPDSNPASSCSVPAATFFDGCCHHDSTKNSTSILDSACQPADRFLVRPDLMLDIPPGFSPVPPGFTKDHCQLQIGTAALSYADVPSKLILDIPPGFPTDIPPGFTEAHRGRPPAISPAGPACVSTPGNRSSLNVPRPGKMGVPLGFTPLHAVKKEPGLPAVNESTDKPTLYSLAAAASAVVKPGKRDEIKITDNEVKIEQDENSEEREFPKIRPLSDLYPLDKAETPQPTSAGLADKFQEQIPDKHMHLRKRVCQASPKPSPAETTIKKLKVNGRIALNKGAGHSNGEARCVCASIGGRAAMPTKRPLSASPGGHLDNESISCVVCGEEIPTP